mmetsp:Transcript_3378/g.3881  ORF Transcript_3378/g.3881 Transcript_3378/m.3881 type:complete len:307 (+) Transcript_3378:1213-2133(+)
MTPLFPDDIVALHAFTIDAGVDLRVVGRSSKGISEVIVYGIEGCFVTSAGRFTPNSLSSAINARSSIGNLRFFILSATSFALASATFFFLSASSFSCFFFLLRSRSSSVITFIIFFFSSNSFSFNFCNLSFSFSFSFSFSSFLFFSLSNLSFSASFFLFLSAAFFIASFAFNADFFLFTQAVFILYEFFSLTNRSSFNPALIALVTSPLNCLGLMLFVCSCFALINLEIAGTELPVLSPISIIASWTIVIYVILPFEDLVRNIVCLEEGGDCVLLLLVLLLGVLSLDAVVEKGEDFAADDVIDDVL